jgi:hypothetical protein
MRFAEKYPDVAGDGFRLLNLPPVGFIIQDIPEKPEK